MDHLSYMQLCRLCLVKDKVNVPIFDDANDVRQIFLKITACLPVKVSRDDNLPKKICNECLYKIDSLYQFWNTTINAEKQLLQWLNEIGVDTTVTNAAAPLQQILPQSHAHPHTEEIILKEEALEDLKPEHNNIIFPSYIPNQQQPPPPNLTKFQPADEEEEDDPPRRRTRGRPAKKKAASVLEAALTAQDSDSVDSDRLADGGADDSDYVDEERVTKEEVDSDEDYVDPLEPTQFVNVSNDAEQPGPSGLNNTAKSTTTLQPPTHTDTGLFEQFITKQDEKFDDQIFDLPVSKMQIDQELMSLFSANDDLLQNITDSFIEDNKELGQFPSAYTDFTLNDHDLLPKTPDFIELVKHDEAKVVNLGAEDLGDNNNKWNCDLCSEKFKRRYDLRLHKKTHENPVYQCQICCKKFNQKSHLTVHRKRHFSDFTQFCQPCNKGFYTKSSYNNHINVTHNNMPHECQICGCKLSTKSSLRDHLKTHQSRDRTEICEKCGKTFLNARNLRSHLKTHLDTRDHCCKVCGKSVSDKKTLAVHLRTHSGDRPLKCDVCDKSFASKAYMKAHLRTHTGLKPYNCTYCDKAFSQRSSLTIHVRYHTGERPYVCASCGKCFVSRTHLNTHLKTHDSQLFPPLM